MYFLVWPISLSKMLLGSIHVAVCIRIPFLFTDEKHFIVCTYNSLITHLSLHEHSWVPPLGWCEYAVNIGAQVSESLFSFFSRYILRSEISGLYNNFLFKFFEEPPNCFPQLLYHFTVPPIINKTPVSPHAHQHVLFFIKKKSINHANGCEMVPHCEFNLTLSDG